MNPMPTQTPKTDQLAIEMAKLVEAAKRCADTWTDTAKIAQRMTRGERKRDGLQKIKRAC